LFLFMAVTSEEGVEQGVRVPSYLGVSSNPTKRVEELNGVEGFPAANRVAKKGAPFWILKLVIGPFAQGARQLAIDWASKSRKVACRIVYAVQMVCRVNVWFDKHVAADEMMRAVGCVPASRLCIWARDTDEIESLVENNKVKPRKRPRATVES
jgi:hypothetical protein